MGRRVSQVADVMRDNGPAFMQKAKRVFQLAPECQHRRRGVKASWHDDGCGCEAASATQHARRAGGNPHHRVIDPANDVAIMQQEVVCNGAQTLLRLVVVNRLRLFCEVAARQHDGARHAVEYQVV